MHSPFHKFNIFAKTRSLKETYKNQNKTLPHSFNHGKVAWRSPSNIALIKYWGKYGIQLPKNPSLSFTLSKSFTETHILFKRSKGEPQRAFLFDNKPNEAFAARIWKYVDSLLPIFPYLTQLDIHIKSHNSFPHSAGIASSASAMSALALCLVDMEKELFGTPNTENAFYAKASYIARLGSGSASRSVYGDYTLWGENTSVQANSSQDFAVPLELELHGPFKVLRDTILIVDQGPKSVSSSIGHSLMEQHPFTDDRLKQADKHLKLLLKAIKSNDQAAFIKIVESEALSLHALMMSSDPWFILMKTETLEILQKIKTFRERTGHFICFTLDAGPNVHLIYGNQNEIEIKAFIEKELKPHCYQGQIIYDRIGTGPQKLDK